MTVEVTYTDEVIRYDEGANKWVWDGRSYTALSGAKKAIDKQYAPDFARVPCLVRRWDKWYLGEITSKTANGVYWVTADVGQGKFERRQERLLDLYQNTLENWEIVQRSNDLLKKADVLHREAEELLNSLTPVFFPAE